MKRIVIIALAAVCTLGSCDRFKEKDYSEEERKIAEAKDAALKSIEDKSCAAIIEAERAISTATAEAVKGAGEDIANAINEAKNEIQASVETSVNETITTRLKEFDKDISDANVLAAVAALIALIALVIAIVSLVLLYRRTSRDNIIETIRGSKRVESRINDLIEYHVKANPNPTPTPARLTINRSDIEAEIKKYLGSPAFKEMITGLRSSEGGAKDVGLSDNKNVAPKVEFFAKDSREMSVSGLTSSYVQGKSLYRLTLTSMDAQTAEISICDDKEDVKRRILKSSDDLLEPICRVERKKNNPEDLSTITTKPGKAEKISDDKWRVTEPIIVELS